MQFSINLLDNDKSIRDAILKEISIHVDQSVRNSINSVKNNVSQIIGESLRQEPEYSSLKSGRLLYEFGIPDTSFVDKVVDAAAGAVEVVYNPVTFNSRGVRGGLKIQALGLKDIDGLIATDIASVNDSKGYSLPWLRWLLLEGGSPIVKNFEVKLGPSRNSRTGNAIMVKSLTNWSVPSSFVGTQSNNWFTRGIERIEDSVIQKAIQQEIEKYI
jgi:hypothetical protein